MLPPPHSLAGLRSLFPASRQSRFATRHFRANRENSVPDSQAFDQQQLLLHGVVRNPFVRFCSSSRQEMRRDEKPEMQGSDATGTTTPFPLSPRVITFESEQRRLWHPLLLTVTGAAIPAASGVRVMEPWEFCTGYVESRSHQTTALN
ncbi:hypothetical protein MPTK1_2g25075 [Marchantia polymorpha subsp. ruderalis]